MASRDDAHEQPHPELVPGAGIGPWVVRERRDRGSFGLVFRVERAGHPEAGSFALKVALHPEDPRFSREVTLLQRTSHPNVPRFEDRGWWKNSEGLDFPYLVMECVEGLPLYEWARQNRPNSSQVLHLGAQLAGALGAAHAARGLHRDVKGGNILVTSEGRAVLLDWGGGTHEGAKEITDTALPPGTSSYRTPEALRWGWAHRKDCTPYEAGPADDVYALGVTIYRLCTGTYPPQPTEGPGPQRELRPPRELATVSMGLHRMLLACLAEARLARPSAAALAIGFSAAAREKDAANPILPNPATEDSDSDQASQPSCPQRFGMPAFPSLGGAAIVSGLLVMIGMALGRETTSVHPQPSPSEQVSEVLSPEAPDGGVGEEVMNSVVNAPHDIVPYTVVALPMPKKPLPGQKKPPCTPRFEREVLGVCWSILEGRPPCETAGYEYEGRCLRAVIEEGRQPASEEPR